jgi:putative ABC transport system permease protein
MRLADIIYLALSGLLQQKVRTSLTTLGVVIGSLVLLLSLSLGQGVRNVLAEMFRKNDDLRKVSVWSGSKPVEADIPPAELDVKGAMSEARRERLREALVRRWQGRPKSPEGLTPERLAQLAAIDHVTAVTPSITLYGRARLGERTYRATFASAQPGDPAYDRRVLAGHFFTDGEPRGVVITEYLLYRLGIRNEADMEEIGGQSLRLEMQPNRPWSGNLLLLFNRLPFQLTPGEEDLVDRIRTRLPAAMASMDLLAEDRTRFDRLLRRLQPTHKRPGPARISQELTITGVLRDPTKEELHENLGGNAFADVLVPSPLLTEVFFEVPDNRERGVPGATVHVDSEENVRGVTDQLEAMGVPLWSPVKILDQMRLNALMISFAMSFVALLALVVAGLGITNTMLMSVLERTHEIGIMKAVGARDGHLQMMFLLEGASIGLIGSGLGLLCAWLASLPGERIARRIAEQQAQMTLEVSLFAFPWWLLAGVPLFVTLLTMLASFYPARQAARIDPVTALRHE